MEGSEKQWPGSDGSTNAGPDAAGARGFGNGVALLCGASANAELSEANPAAGSPSRFDDPCGVVPVTRDADRPSDLPRPGRKHVVQRLNGGFSWCMDNPHAALAARLQTTRREADAVHAIERAPAATPGALPIYAWFGIEPPEGLRCSRGCHLFGPNANFDPHTGERIREGRQQKHADSRTTPARVLVNASY